MDHKTLFAGFEQEVRLEKQRENFLKARQILSDKQNTTSNLQERYAEEVSQLGVITEAWVKFTADGDLNSFMTAIKDTNYFGKR